MLIVLSDDVFKSYIHFCTGENESDWFDFFFFVIVVGGGAVWLAVFSVTQLTSNSVLSCHNRYITSIPPHISVVSCNSRVIEADKGHRWELWMC